MGLIFDHWYVYRGITLRLILSIAKLFLALKKYWYYFFYRNINLLRVKKHRGELFIGGPTLLSKNTILNANPNFNGMVIKGTGEVTFGDNFHSGESCLIITDNHDFDGGDAVPYGDKVISKSVTIGDNVWLGDRVLILGGANIGEGAIVQAGSVVVGKIPALAIIGGVPATPFKSRDADNYYKLKSLGKFH